VISGFNREVREICALLECYAAYIGTDVSGTVPETSVSNSHNTLRNITEERKPQEELNSQETD